MTSLAPPVSAPAPCTAISPPATPSSKPFIKARSKNSPPPSSTSPKPCRRSKPSAPGCSSSSTTSKANCSSFPPWRPSPGGSARLMEGSRNLIHTAFLTPCSAPSTTATSARHQPQRHRSRPHRHLSHDRPPRLGSQRPPPRRHPPCRLARRRETALIPSHSSCIELRVLVGRSLRLSQRSQGWSRWRLGGNLPKMFSE